MHSIRRSLVGLSLLGVTLLAGAPSPAQAATSNGPYYAEPAWDQKLACPNTANCPRFIVLTDWNSAAVLDRETGLVWEKSPSTPQFTSWSDARSSCMNTNVGGRLGWRLPSIPELASLVDPSVVGLPVPTLPPGHPFPDVLPAFYWSASSIVEVPTDAWAVHFFFGVVTAGHKTAGGGRAWCVRGGMNADAY